MFCPRCKNQIADYSNTCPFCGQWQCPPYPPGMRYSYNSDDALFQNPHTGLLVLVIVSAFITSVLGLCAVIGSLYVFYSAPVSLLSGILSFAAYILTYIMMFTASLKHRKAKTQLWIMNIFLILSWLAFTVYFACIMICNLWTADSDGLPRFFTPAISGSLFLVLLISTTTMKCIYAGKLKRAYQMYLYNQSSSPRGPLLRL